MHEVPLVMPKLSMTMTEGVLVAWHKQPGDNVAEGDAICDVATDKVDMEVESPVAGVLARFAASVQDSVAVGVPLAFIETEADDLLGGLLGGPPADSPAQPMAGSVEEATSSTEETTGRATPPSRKGPVPAAPAARRRASLLGIDLDSVRPLGTPGVITVADVERAVQLNAGARAGTASPSSAPSDKLAAPAARRTPAAEPTSALAPPTPPTAAATAQVDPGYASLLDGRRRAVRAVIAERMTQSAAVPQFTTWIGFDLQELSRARGRVGWTALMVRAYALALRRNPALNATWDGSSAGPQEVIGVSLAVDTPIGLLAPVLRDPDLLPLAELDASLRDVLDRTRSGKLRADELEGGTSTLSNLGGFGVTQFQALLTPPQGSALSLGAIAPAPVAIGEALAVRMVCQAGLTVDHRVADGADAGRLLSDMRTILAGTSLLTEPPRQAR
jgi:pyruvate dehydrogenase E2 component (dihydrolipoamide acetyltransferase)